MKKKKTVTKPREKESSNILYPISRLIPNTITVTAICFGLTSIRYALDGKWEISTILIIIAGFLDVLDGRMARFLKASSVFGAHLDSLSDFINFGVAPAVTIYLWELHNIPFKGIGWGVVLFYSISCSIRLARFNTDMFDNKKTDLGDYFFVGVPAPAGAYLALMPMMLSFKFDIHNSILPYFQSIYTIAVAILMVSKIPTFATKKLKISKNNTPMALVIISIIVVITTLEPWIVLILIGLAYILLIPFSIKSYNKKIKEITDFS